MTDQAAFDLIRGFVESLGLSVQPCTLSDDTFLPGLELTANGIWFDAQRLRYPGDLLHEAGHLAVTTAAQRAAIGTDQLQQPFPPKGDEIATLLWTYAAARHIGLPLPVLFHPHGYKSDGDWLIEQFESGNHIGLPLLEWMGLTLSPARAAATQQQPFPHMLQWLRD
jgi:hypothetical protein